MTVKYTKQGKNTQNRIEDTDKNKGLMFTLARMINILTRRILSLYSKRYTTLFFFLVVFFFQH